MRPGVLAPRLKESPDQLPEIPSPGDHLGPAEFIPEFPDSFLILFCAAHYDGGSSGENPEKVSDIFSIAALERQSDPARTQFDPVNPDPEPLCVHIGHALDPRSVLPVKKGPGAFGTGRVQHQMQGRAGGKGAGRLPLSPAQGAPMGGPRGEALLQLRAGWVR